MDVRWISWAAYLLVGSLTIAEGQSSEKVLNGFECEAKVANSAWFRCKDDRHRCVSDEALCDGIRDCGDASDEVAIGWAPVNQCKPGHLPDYSCLENYHKCHTIQGAGCLSDVWKCDGTQHCQDDSDEKDCPNINFQLSSSTVLGVFIFALLIFTVTLCVAVIGVYATNKARNRRRAARRSEEQRQRLRNVFAVSDAVADVEGLDNPIFDADRRASLMSPPPYALVVEAAILEEQRGRGESTTMSSADLGVAKPPSYEDIYGPMSLAAARSSASLPTTLHSSLPPPSPPDQILVHAQPPVDAFSSTIPIPALIVSVVGESEDVDSEPEVDVDNLDGENECGENAEFIAEPPPPYPFSAVELENDSRGTEDENPDENGGNIVDNAGNNVDNAVGETRLTSVPLVNEEPEEELPGIQMWTNSVQDDQSTI